MLEVEEHTVLVSSSGDPRFSTVVVHPDGRVGELELDEVDAELGAHTNVET